MEINAKHQMLRLLHNFALRNKLSVWPLMSAGFYWPHLNLLAICNWISRPCTTHYYVRHVVVVTHLVDFTHKDNIARIKGRNYFHFSFWALFVKLDFSDSIKKPSLRICKRKKYESFFHPKKYLPLQSKIFLRIPLSFSWQLCPCEIHSVLF